jgi:N-acetylneuraminic acid mutarotase
MRFYSSSITLGLAAYLVAGQGGTWERLASIADNPRQEHSTVALSRDTLAILGGIVPTDTFFETTNILQLYNIPQNKWTTATPAPIRANHPNVASIRGHIYLLGGMNDAPDAAWEGFPQSFVYKSATDVWVPLPPMPVEERRGAAAMGVYNDIIYLAGGLRRLELFEGGSQDTMDILSAFDTRSGVWLPVPDAARHLPEGRDHAGGAVVGHHFYVLGGRFRGHSNNKDTVFVLDLLAMEGGWRVSNSRMPTPRGGLSAATVGSKVYTFGGEGSLAEPNGVFNQTEVFDTKTESWKVLAPMPVPRHGTSAVAIGEVIYIPGGGIVLGGAPVDVMDAFRPASQC